MPIMPHSRKPAVNYLFYSLYAIIMAAIYGLFTYFGIFARGTEGFALRTYIWNLILIVIVLIVDKVYISKLRKSADYKKPSVKPSKVLHFISFKASLYLFYMFAVTASRLMLLLDIAETEAFFNFRTYVLSIEYGLILLVAADKFIDQFVKDKKLMKEVAER